MSQSYTYLEQIEDLIRSNGWEGQLVVELISSQEDRFVRVRLGKQHPTAPLDIVNDYWEALNPLEQVQQECLRALRTGRPGI